MKSASVYYFSKNFRSKWEFATTDRIKFISDREYLYSELSDVFEAFSGLGLFIASAQQIHPPLSIDFVSYES